MGLNYLVQVSKDVWNDGGPRWNMHWFLGIFEFWYDGVDITSQWSWLNLLYQYINFLFYTNLVHGLVNIAIKTSFCFGFFFSSPLDWEKKEDVNFCHILFLSSFKFLLVLWINFSCFISSLWFQLVFRHDYKNVSSYLFIMIHQWPVWAIS